MNFRIACIAAVFISFLPTLRANTLEDRPQTVQSSAVLYGLALQAAQRLYAELQSFICTEHVERYRKTEDGQTTLSLGTLSSRLSFEKGLERYSEIIQNGKVLSRISEVDGAWSNGNFGTLILQTIALLRSAKPISSRYEEIDGTPAQVFGFEVESAESPWDLQVGNLHFRLPFHADIWVSALTAQILKISRISTAMPAGTGIYRICWGVTLGAVDVSGRTWLVPKAGEYVVSYDDSQRVDSNLLTFSDYHRYEALSTVKFEGLQ